MKVGKVAAITILGTVGIVGEVVLLVAKSGMDPITAAVIPSLLIQLAALVLSANVERKVNGNLTSLINAKTIQPEHVAAVVAADAATADAATKTEGAQGA